MSHPLDGCWAKIERADEQIDDLHTEITTFFQFASDTIVRNFDPDKREWTFTAFDKGIPLHFPVRIGEIVHNLRTSLDHLIWALLIKRHSKGPPHHSLAKLQFPIALTRKYYESRFRHGIEQAVSLGAKAIIEKVQPYSKATPSDAPLAILDDFSNTDKHRLLVVAVTAVGVPASLYLGGEKNDYGQITFIPSAWAGHTVQIAENGTEILKLMFTKTPAKPEVKADFSFQIALEKFGPDRLKPIYPALMHLRDSVVQTLNLFRSEF